jgi:hypothetical protein
MKDKMTKLEKLIKEKCDIPIVSVKLYKADKLAEELGVANNEIIAMVKFGISVYLSSSLLKGVDNNKISDIVAKQISDLYREKMKLAGIKVVEL